MKRTPHSHFQIILTGLMLAAALFGALGGSIRTVNAQRGTGVIRIAPYGQNVNTCGSPDLPCKTLAYGVKRANANDLVLVAQGTYTFDAGTTPPIPCSDSGTTSAVLCVNGKNLTLVGGYSGSDWASSDPVRYPTIIDGQGAYRGASLQNGTYNMKGFTIQNGRAQGANSGTDYQTQAYGGGLIATNSALTLRNMIFKNNLAKGGDLNAEIGAPAVGGGLTIINYQPTTAYNLIDTVVFESNSAKGGRGNQRGGNGIGGGLHVYNATVGFKNLTFRNNLAEGGPTNGSGLVGGTYADAQGGAAAIYFGSVVTFENITATDNQTLGGDAPNGSGGGAFGGALYFEHANTTISDAVLRGNLAEGGTGNGGAGGLSEGGAIQTDGTNIVLNRVSVIANIARGGTGKVKGAVGGGGLALTRITPDEAGAVAIVDSVIADNRVEQGTGTASGGGGGGLWLQGTTGTVQHTTIARNSAGSGLIGQGVLLIATPLPATARFDYVIIADHPTDAAVYVQQGASVVMNRGLWSGNTKDTNAGGYQPGTISGLATMLTGAANFVSPGAPNYDYHIKGTSAARNQANASTQQTDLDDDSRTLFAPADIGADEYLPIVLTVTPVAPGKLRLSWKPDGWLASATHHYTISFTKENGAANPAEGTSAIDAGTNTSFVLTGLTNGAQYTFRIQAFSSSALLDQSNSVVAIPAKNFLFLPSVLR
jgi:hypothetical protein